MKNSLLTQSAHGGVTVYNLYPLSNDDVAEEREEGEDGRKGGGAVDDGKGNMEDFDAIGQVSDTLSILIGVGDNNDLVASVDQLRRELVDVAFDSSGLRVEEIAHHGDIVRSTRHRQAGADDNAWQRRIL